ncbi:MAG: thiamine pyrophosphate-binding protein [Alphaproteobacteria bacterium]|nr:thiamine pyrophosphate-binding protein [Alphaproteobacteria bacterium]
MDTQSPDLRTGGQLLVDALVTHGADMVFCVPGESYLAALDALHDANSIRTIVCRQEGGAANMAEAYGKLTGRPGICMVTRGPGATNASIGVHTAFQDSTPMILLIGQVGRSMLDREAFQEVDFRQMFGPLAKWAAQIDSAARVPEYLSHAFHVATSGRAGPVVLALPEDVLRETAPAVAMQPYQSVAAHPASADLERMRALLASAQRPVVIAGGGGWSAQACQDLAAFAERNDLPVAVSLRCQDYLDNRHRCYVGDVALGINPKLAERVRTADVLLAIGTRLGEMTTSGYSLIEPPRPRQTLIHVHAGADELGRVYQPELAINAASPIFLAAAKELDPVDASGRADWRAGARTDYEAALETAAPQPGAVDMVEVMAHLRAVLPEDAIITNGAGNYTAWPHKFLQYRSYRTQLGPIAGAMGYGVPAAVAAKLVHPDRVVVSFNGDGCFLMNGQELATAVQHDVDPIFVVINNGMYGTIRMHQEREYPTRVHATDLVNPDFVKLAEAYGAHGELVENTAEFAPAFARCREAGRASLIEIRIDPEAITPRTTLSEIRETALAR